MPHSCYKGKKMYVGAQLGAAKVREMSIYKARARMDR